MMNKFKQGDKVKCNRSLWSGVGVGDVLEVKDNFTTTDGLWYAGEGFVNTKWLNRADRRLFELVPETPMFDMKTTPWYIRVNSQAEFDAAVNFALAQGCRENRYNSAYLPNVTRAIGTSLRDDDLFLFDTEQFYWLGEDSLTEVLGRHEIKITFKTVVDKVEYPAVESETQKQIRELKETIEKAQQQIIKLEKENS